MRILVVSVVFDVFLECSDVFVGYTGDVGKVEYSCLIKEEVCEGVFQGLCLRKRLPLFYKIANIRGCWPILYLPVSVNFQYKIVTIEVIV